MSNKDDLQQAVYDQQLLVNAFESDLASTHRLEKQIEGRLKEITRLEAEIERLRVRIQTLPEQTRVARVKLGQLKRAAALASNPDVKRLLRLAEKLNSVDPGLLESSE